MGSQTYGQLKKKAPQIVIITVAVALTAYILFEILEDVFIQGAPWNSGPLIGFIVGFTHSTTSTVSSWEYGGVFGLMLLESSSLPIPSEVILPFSGYLVSTGKLDIWLTVIVATVAAMIGSLIDYYIGLKGVQVLTKYRLLGRSIVSEAQLKVAAGWFSRYGPFMVFVGRLIPGFRTIISFPAGAVRMPIAKFFAYTLAGCLLWNSLLIYIGYYLGSNWEDVAGVSHYVIIAAIAGLIVLAAAYLVVRRNRRKKLSQATQKYLV